MTRTNVVLGISGPDGAGKSTLAAALAARLTADGVPARVVYLYGCVACRRWRGAAGRGGRRAGRRRGATGFARSATRRAHAGADAMELIARLDAARARSWWHGGRAPAVLVTDRSPLDGIVKHAPAHRSVAGLLYRRAIDGYARIAVLDTNADVLAARDGEHGQDELEELRERFRVATAGLGDVALSLDASATIEELARASLDSLADALHRSQRPVGGRRHEHTERHARIGGSR